MNIIVTGSSRGIGLAILEKYAYVGWNLAFCSKNPDSVTKAKQHLQSINANIKIYAEALDMENQDAVLRFAKNCLKEFGSIDILVNNAGLFQQGDLCAENFDDSLDYLMRVNLFSAYWMGKCIIPQMIKNKSGHVFNISSIAGLKDYDNGGGYTVAKFALTGYTKQIRNELKSKHVKVTGIYPGAVLTDSWAGVDLPDNRFIQPSDIAEIIYTTSQLSPSACVEDIIIRPQEGDI
ncbi:MAG: SDR family oxidoreductase [Chitinophagales bacterium]|nr:SDR family oxidoreductase [Chitinophagales bacterium]